MGRKNPSLPILEPLDLESELRAIAEAEEVARFNQIHGSAVPLSELQVYRNVILS
jgi:hypothetical protein